MAHSTVDYSKWDHFVDSDEEREKTRKADVERDTKGFQETRARNREIIDAGRQAKLRGKLRECGLFEDLIPPFTPDNFLELRWGGENVALFGNFLPCRSLRKKPKLTYDCPDDTRLHTVLFLAVPDFLSVDQIRTMDDEVDPEAAVADTLSEERAKAAAEANRKPFVHWLRINVRGPSDVTGEDAIEYLPPCPRRLEGFFRYCLIVFKQGGTLRWSEPKIRKDCVVGRDTLNVKSFIATHKLRPIGANVVRTAWDESANETRETIKDA
jgi:hypothetical protein